MQESEEIWVPSISGSGRYPGEGNGNLLQYSCLENFMDKGAWQATVHWATKSQDMTEWLSTTKSEHLGFRIDCSHEIKRHLLLEREVMTNLDNILEKAMATHSSTLSWQIPWTEGHGRLQSMGSRRLRHDWATSLLLFTFMHGRRKWQPTPVFLPGESQGQQSLVSCHLWGRTESDTTEVT